MQRSVSDLMSGSLRPNDPRRFLIEAMIGAMHADGSVDAREAETVQHLITNHTLFRGLAAAAARTLIELSTDAIKFAGSSVSRTPSIAKGLPYRIHRLAAYGMAAEVAAADEHVVDGELTFLEALRVALRISPAEAEATIEAARAGQLAPFLDDRYLRIRSLIPIVAEVFAVRAIARGNATDEQRFELRDFFAAIPDLALATDDLDAALYRAFRRPRAPNAAVFQELAHLAGQLPDPVDRYWIVVYALVVETPSRLTSWRVIPFMGVMQASFQISDTDMELALIDALTFPASVPRPR